MGTGDRTRLLAAVRPWEGRPPGTRIPSPGERTATPHLAELQAPGRGTVGGAVVLSFIHATSFLEQLLRVYISEKPFVKPREWITTIPAPAQGPASWAPRLPSGSPGHWGPLPISGGRDGAPGASEQQAAAQRRGKSRAGHRLWAGLPALLSQPCRPLSDREPGPAPLTACTRGPSALAHASSQDPGVGCPARFLLWEPSPHTPASEPL